MAPAIIFSRQFKMVAGSSWQYKTYSLSSLPDTITTERTSLGQCEIYYSALSNRDKINWTTHRMAAQERFCLRWNDFESNLSKSFRELREEADFFDLTLSVGDQQIQAHKLVLSACSPFFRSVLKQNPHQHPLLYLKGTVSRDYWQFNEVHMGEKIFEDL